MKFIPYSRQWVTAKDIEAVVAVLQSDFLTQGDWVPGFEQAFAERHGFPYAVAVCNATAGLHLACLALGVGLGSRVWTSPNSFLASANCALYCGATVDFVDIDPKTRNMSISALAEKLQWAQQRGELPHVVIPVDFSGFPCDAKEIRALADHYGFKILQDAAHATGASYLGRPLGSAFSDAVVFSFHAVKIITCGEGGLVGTHDPGIAHRLRLMRSHGMMRDPARMSRASEGAWYYEQQELGFNFRMTDIQAALGLSQLGRLDELRARREQLASRYDDRLRELSLILPPRSGDRASSWHLYVVEIGDVAKRASRADVFARLRSKGIGVNVHYIPIHTQPYYARKGFRQGDFPACERYYERALSIPLFPAMTDSQQDYVVDQLAEALG